ncbi:hypothetical protein [Actinacidiphila sp. ITFR-21]|uniref:hypothetical protein n=1 Tax=Actinacidiphila sp. ITFR-21 TaxID=3075199 RepID=UPI00288A09A1|nr:hypothetical protein [Streptomyces sp. ITFR-21]WNI17622.1 hypothetical protein RLT57_20245 [Streptomyces sp. ITFR-21]WNI17762.1 hypothetical protein RLT57_20960 [Streptomyces sp. ITFR-21]
MAGRQLAQQTVPTSGGNVVTTSAVGAANGVAGLDSGGKVPASQIPDLSSSYTTVTAFGNAWTAVDHGLISWAFDPACCSSAGTSLTAGYIYLVQILLRNPATISKISVVLGTAGATLTANQCLAGLYSSTGTRLALTADQSTAWASAGQKAMSLSSAFSAAAGKYFVALVVNGTTPPTFACGSTYGANFTPGNANLTASNYRFCRSAAAGNTSLPTSITLSGYTPDANNVWTGVF